MIRKSNPEITQSIVLTALSSALLLIGNLVMFIKQPVIPRNNTTDSNGNVGASASTVNRQTQAAPVPESEITTNTGSGKGLGPLWTHSQTRCRRRPPSRGRPTGWSIPVADQAARRAGRERHHERGGRPALRRWGQQQERLQGSQSRDTTSWPAPILVVLDHGY